MSGVIKASYQECGSVARKATSSFYWSFWLLPPPKRRAMYALYAFSRHTDDLCDNVQPVEIRRSNLSQWRESLQRAFAGQMDHRLLPALIDTVNRYGIPREYLFDVIDGVEMDLKPPRYETFDELRQYSYRVASAVGLACIHVWGFKSDAVREPAVSCGIAFQLTNILRDLREDAAQDRVYLPLEDFRRFDYSVDELKRGISDERFAALVRFEAQRAEQLFREAASLPQHLYADGRRAANMMIATYWRLLQRVKRRCAAVLSGRVHLGLREKIAVGLSTMLGQGITSPRASRQWR